MNINKQLSQPWVTWGCPGAILISFGSRVKGHFSAQGVGPGHGRAGPGCGNTKSTSFLT